MEVGNIVGAQYSWIDKSIAKCPKIPQTALFACSGHVGFSLPGGGGGSIEPPKTGGGGFGKRAQLTGTINQSLSSLAPKAPKIFSSTKIGRFFSPNIWQMTTFLNPLNALIPKIPFSFFPDFWI